MARPVWRVWRAGCSFISGLLVKDFSPAGADGICRSAPHLTLELCARIWVLVWRIAVRPVCHHTLSCLAQPFRGHLLCRFVSPVANRGYTGWASKFGWYARSWVNKAQIVRAVLLARATTTTFAGRRSARRTAHTGGALLLVNTERAPWISSVRR